MHTPGLFYQPEFLRLVQTGLQLLKSKALSTQPNMDPPSAAAMLAASVAAAEKSPDDPSVLEKARSTAFHSLATLRAALRAGVV